MTFKSEKIEDNNFGVVYTNLLLSANNYTDLPKKYYYFFALFNLFVCALNGWPENKHFVPDYKPAFVSCSKI
ncbi:hypothetical protein C0V77_01240 [Emticicia sp. TH156]|nr:hypothetical protein C0V77_01240 [Emticicia sp. TH156]